MQRGKKDRIIKKITVVIFRLFGGESPTVLVITKICPMGRLPDVITCAKFQVEIFKGYDVTGGGEFPMFL